DDASAGNRALDHHRVTQMRQREFRGIPRGTRHLETAIDAIERTPDDLVGGFVQSADVVVHAIAPTFCNARATVRRASSTLNALSRNGTAPATAASLAAAMVSRSSRCPTSARSAASARHGLCAT